MSYVSYISSLPIPDCAPQINGSFLEAQIPGYRTIRVESRQKWSSSITEIDGDLKDGSIYRRKRDNNREFSVIFGIIADSKTTYNTSWDRLRWLLFGQESSKFIFNDEPTKYVIGNVTSLEDETVDGTGSGVYAGAGSFTVHLSDPYKYAVDEKACSLADGAFTLVYTGFYIAKPRFEITLTNAIGGITLIDSSGNTLLFGDMSLGLSDSTSKFSAGDVVKIDTSDISILINDVPQPGAGDIANAWEDFGIQNGSNSIKYTITSGGESTATMYYREVYR